MPRSVWKAHFLGVAGVLVPPYETISTETFGEQGFAIAKCRSTTERNGQHQLSVICRSRFRNDSQYHFFAYLFDKLKTPNGVLHLQKIGGWFFFRIPNIFFASKFFPPGMAGRQALLGWQWLQYSTIPLPQLQSCNCKGPSTERV